MAENFFLKQIYLKHTQTRVHTKHTLIATSNTQQWLLLIKHSTADCPHELVYLYRAIILLRHAIIQYSFHILALASLSGLKTYTSPPFGEIRGGTFCTIAVQYSIASSTKTSVSSISISVITGRQLRHLENASCVFCAAKFRCDDLSECLMSTLGMRLVIAKLRAKFYEALAI